MDTKIFNRTEKKYIITENQRQFLLEQILSHMQRDNYFESEVYNIYFDTDNYDLIIQSIDHPIFKEKFRARSYGGYDKVFLEIKTKIRGLAFRRDLLENDDLPKDNNIGFKRRVLITKQDFEELINGKATAETLAARSIERGSDTQIAREVDYMINHFDLKPKILVYYNRESYIDEKGLRVTFDTDLHYRTEQLEFAKNPYDKTFFNSDKNIIMEVKTRNAMPLWLAKALSSEHIYPEQFSKIGKVYEQIIKIGEKKPAKKKAKKSTKKKGA